MRLLLVSMVALGFPLGSFVRCTSTPGRADLLPSLGSEGLRWPLGTPEAHKSLPHFPVRKGALVTARPDGLVHVVEACGADHDACEPSVLWYCMQSPRSCTSCPFAPYYTPTPYPPGYPNPNLPPTLPNQANITRSWRAPPTYYVNIPAGATGTTDIFATTTFGGPYTYDEFAWDCAHVVARYGQAFSTVGHPALPAGGSGIGPHPCPPSLPSVIGSTNTATYAVFGGITTGNYNIGTGVAPTMTGLIWSAPVGPTGNNFNELVFFVGDASVGGIPKGVITSMIMDPRNGSIIECDVALGTGAYTWPARNQPPCVVTPPCFTGGPSWTTAIPHGVGHFFGLDHTNLHPGGAPASSGTPCNPQPSSGNAPPVNGAPASFSVFPANSYLSWPAMVQNVSWTGAYWCQPSPAYRHSDDESAMAELYPVTAPSPAATTPQLLPAINVAARIEGTVFNGATRIFGANLMPLLPGIPAPASVGKVSGTGRLTQGIGVVGATDTATTFSTNGEFRIERVPLGSVTPLIPGVRYDIATEPLDSLGFNTLPGNVVMWGEWFYHPTFNPALNPLTVVNPNQQLLQANGAFFPLWISGPYGSPGNPPLGSLFAVPGSIIQVSVNLATLGNVPEYASRPVVMLSPRNGKPAGFNPATSTITATVIHDYQLDFASAVWSVSGGVTLPAGAFITNQPPTPTGPGPYTTTWNTTFGSLGINTVASTATVKFMVREVAGGSAGVPITLVNVMGINEVVY